MSYYENITIEQIEAIYEMGIAVVCNGDMKRALCEDE